MTPKIRQKSNPFFEGRKVVLLQVSRGDFHLSLQKNKSMWVARAQQENTFRLLNMKMSSHSRLLLHHLLLGIVLSTMPKSVVKNLIILHTCQHATDFLPFELKNYQQIFTVENLRHFCKIQATKISKVFLTNLHFLFGWRK